MLKNLISIKTVLNSTSLKHLTLTTKQSDQFFTVNLEEEEVRLLK